MGSVRSISLYCLLALCLLAVLGCGKKVDENKPVSKVEAEAEKTNVEQLREMALKYKEAIAAKKADIDEIVARLKKIPITDMVGEEARTLKSDIENLNKSVSALNKHFEIYYNKLKEKGGDLSELKI